MAAKKVEPSSFLQLVSAEDDIFDIKNYVAEFHLDNPEYGNKLLAKSLMAECEYENVEKLYIDIIKALVDEDNDLANSSHYYSDQFPIHRAQICEVSKFLIANGANVNVVDKEGRTPLFYSKSADNIDLLLKHGADINHQDNFGNTLIMHCAQNKKNSFVKYLVTLYDDNWLLLCNPNIANKEGKGLLDIYKDDHDMLAFLMKRGVYMCSDTLLKTIANDAQSSHRTQVDLDIISKLDFISKMNISFNEDSLQGFFSVLTSFYQGVSSEITFPKCKDQMPISITRKNLVEKIDKINNAVVSRKVDYSNSNPNTISLETAFDGMMLIYNNAADDSMYPTLSVGKKAGYKLTPKFVQESNPIKFYCT